MERRDFLQAVAAFVATPDIFSLLPQTNEISDFDPAHQYGRYVRITDYAPEVVEEAWLFVMREAKACLPRGTKFEIIDHAPGSSGTDDPLDEYATIAWRYSPKYRYGAILMTA